MSDEQKLEATNARAMHTPVSLEDCRRNNRLQIQQCITGAGEDTLRTLIRDLRERIARDVATLEEAELQLLQREGRSDG